MSDEQKTDGNPESVGPQPIVSPLISIDDFSKVRLMTAEVVAAEEIPKADKLLKLTLKLANEQKQIVAGIKQHYSATPPPPIEPPAISRPDWEPPAQKPCIVGKTIIIVDNLQPTKLRGVDSNGMLLAVRLPDGTLSLLTTDKLTPSGLRVG